jgi:hypothetical protein
MVQASKPTGIALALIERFETQRLPRALALKGKLEQGGLLSAEDITFLETVLRDGTQIMQLADKNPEWQSLYARVANLYQEITAKALANEKLAGGNST